MMDSVTLTLVLGLAGIAATIIGIVITWLITRHYSCQHTPAETPPPEQNETLTGGDTTPGWNR
jgi:hypothetical protein